MRKLFLLSCIHVLAACGHPASNDSNSKEWLPLPETVTVTQRRGNPKDDPAGPRKGGLILMGGGADVDSAFIWAHRQIAGNESTRRGDVLILRASGSDGYDQYLDELAPFNSVQTLIISPKATRKDLAMAAVWVQRAEFVFFAGGNQSHYVGWKNSELMDAVQNLWRRGGVIGGTSAGLAILGQFIFDAKSAGSANVTTQDAVEDPFVPTVSFTRNMLDLSWMHGVITDSHFEERDRLGRLTSFMARQIVEGHAPAPITGIGINEGTALLLDGTTGLAQRAQGSTGAVFIIRGGAAQRIEKGASLLYERLKVLRLDADGQSYDFKKSCGTGAAYELTIDGGIPGFYSPPDAYTKPAAAGDCPKN
jgi:cyanophycinase-like exopeptidase